MGENNFYEYLIPGYGSYLSIRDAINNPTAGNIGMAALSTLGDVGSLVGIGLLGKAAVGSIRAGRAATSALNGLNKSRQATWAARQAAQQTAKQANRQVGRVYSIGQMGGNTQQILQAQKAANAARDLSRAKQAEYMSQAAREQDMLRQANILGNRATQASKQLNNAKTFTWGSMATNPSWKAAGIAVNEMSDDQIGSYKNGSEIHIKKKNRGKFTASTEKAGKTVQQHARDILADPNATPLQKKRANFARNAAKWKHEEGAKIHKLSGHRSILDNGWIPTTRLKKGTYGFIKTKK